ncbi:glutathione S-transferase [Setomelanomma holmii]|uniref:Glutathione S-transferase n=1 Tax=Setomelanomma holmii TaxID=210430 RepID=A0A9P4LJY4_9PLEO|nr:glutathione S-transferase [Setomelanomma holmii]
MVGSESIAIDTSTNKQKQDWFLSLNPNGRIPIIVDNIQNPPFAVMETSAELIYLLEFDKNNYFGLDNDLERNEALQWLFFWHGGGAPYQGKLGFFCRAKEQSSFAIDHFRKETYRVFDVLKLRLSGKSTAASRDYLVAEGRGKYSVSDIGAWAWVKDWSRSGFTMEEMANFPHLLKWIDRIAERPAVKRGISSKYT